MRLKSAAAPATVIEDKPLFMPLYMGKAKGRKIQKPGDLPDL
jgi:hypothetical protein